VLDRRSKVPLYAQMRAQITRAIHSGAGGGVRLPPTRLFARMLGVSRNTVLAAYDDLAATGLIEGRRGSEMRIVPPAKRHTSPFDPRRLLRQAQYPARTCALVDPDGTMLYLTY
jgi:GntR family transcriptional regulator/MocR family aminotransferase